MNERPTTLHFPGHLPFPITVTSLLVQPQSAIRKHDRLLVYKFVPNNVIEEQSDVENISIPNKEMVDQFDSPWDGVVTEWHVKEGSVVHSSSYSSSVCLCLILASPLSPS
jgi:RNA polymerase II subunit A-like phosphatase